MGKRNGEGIGYEKVSRREERREEGRKGGREEERNKIQAFVGGAQCVCGFCKRGGRRRVRRRKGREDENTERYISNCVICTL